MPDQFESFRNFAQQGVDVNPLPATEVRRRGDRLRRRNVLVAAAGALVAVVLVATPLAVIAADRDDRGAPVPSTSPGVTEADLITVEQVPTRDRLGAWRQTEPTEAPTLACQPEPLSVLDADAILTREFRANIAGTPDSEPPSSAVNTAVLQFPDEASATAAYDTVAGWIKDCSAPLNGLEPHKYAEFVQPAVEGGRGEWRHRSFLAPDVCTDCDAVRFHRMGVAQLGDRLALVELAEVGGPLEPELLKEAMTELFAEVVSAAAP